VPAKKAMGLTHALQRFATLASGDLEVRDQLNLAAVPSVPSARLTETTSYTAVLNSST
jgi:hypothetical protein